MAKQAKLSAAEERAQFEQNCVALAKVYENQAEAETMLDDYKTEAAEIAAKIKAYLEANDATFFDKKKTQTVNGITLKKTSTNTTVVELEKDVFSQSSFNDAYPTLCTVELSTAAVKLHWGKDEASKDELRELGVNVTTKNTTAYSIKSSKP
jgi:hypothetical protein